MREGARDMPNSCLPLYPFYEKRLRVKRFSLVFSRFFARALLPEAVLSFSPPAPCGQACPAVH